MKPMVVVRLVAALGVITMLVIIISAFSQASFADDGAAVLALTWGRVTLVDLYLALLLAWLWIAWRERSVVRSVLWLIAVVVTGSLATFAYLLGASLRATDPLELVVGPHRGPETMPGDDEASVV